jgi:hypothetical protein
MTPQQGGNDGGSVSKQKKSHTRNKKPIIPGPSVCSPVVPKSSQTTTRKAYARRNDASCLPNTVYQKIKTVTLRTKKNHTVTRKNLSKKLGCTPTNERCIVNKSKLSYKEKSRILQKFFRPPMPNEWKRDPDMWLNSDDITKVMKQYEDAYPEFMFLGVVPIDFSAPNPYVHETARSGSADTKCMNPQFCKVDIQEARKSGYKIIGAIFNLDPHYKSGSHWVALAIDLPRNRVYYFDSYGLPPPSQIAHYMRYLTIQEPKFRLESNGRRFQYSNTECGMYSMYFLICILYGESFKKFCKKPVSDSWMLKFRKVLFDPTASNM